MTTPKQYSVDDHVRAHMSTPPSEEWGAVTKSGRIIMKSAQEFYDASWQSRRLCGRCVARAFKELCKEGKA